MAGEISQACPRWDSVGQVTGVVTKYCNMMYPELLEEKLEKCEEFEEKWEQERSSIMKQLQNFDALVCEQLNAVEGILRDTSAHCKALTDF